MSQLLLELFSEEIPARMQRRAADDLKRLAAEALKEASLSFGELHCYATPRRLALVIDDLADAQPDVKEEKRGPRTDAPEKAVEGFLRANGITLDACEKRVAGKGEFWFAVIERTGRPTRDVLAEILPTLIHKLPWQKSMRWGSGSFRWVRPLQRVMCLYDGRALEIETPDGVPCGNVTSGHRFLSPATFEGGYFDDYEKMLQRNNVVVRGKVRRDLIAEKAAALAEEAGFKLKRDAALLAEVGGLVEWPVVLMGKIDAVFMDLPAEVLVTSMRSHQKYFAVEDAHGKLGARFIVVANMEASDGGAAGAPVGRDFLLGSGPQAEAGGASNAFAGYDVPRKTRQSGGQGVASRSTVGRVGGLDSGRGCRIRAAGGDAVQGRSDDRHGR